MGQACCVPRPQSRRAAKIKAEARHACASALDVAMPEMAQHGDEAMSASPLNATNGPGEVRDTPGSETGPTKRCRWLRGRLGKGRHRAKSAAKTETTEAALDDILEDDGGVITEAVPLGADDARTDHEQLRRSSRSSEQTPTPVLSPTPRRPANPHQFPFIDPADTHNHATNSTEHAGGTGTPPIRTPSGGSDQGSVRFSEDSGSPDRYYMARSSPHLAKQSASMPALVLTPASPPMAARARGSRGPRGPPGAPLAPADPNRLGAPTAWYRGAQWGRGSVSMSKLPARKGYRRCAETSPDVDAEPAPLGFERMYSTSFN